MPKPRTDLFSTIATKLEITVNQSRFERFKGGLDKFRFCNKHHRRLKHASVIIMSEAGPLFRAECTPGRLHIDGNFIDQIATQNFIQQTSRSADCPDAIAPAHTTGDLFKHHHMARATVRAEENNISKAISGKLLTTVKQERP